MSKFLSADTLFSYPSHIYRREKNGPDQPTLPAMIVVIYVPRDFSEVNHFSFPSLWDLVLSHEDRNDGVSVPDMVRSCKWKTHEATLVILSRNHGVTAVAKPLCSSSWAILAGFPSQVYQRFAFHPRCQLTVSAVCTPVMPFDYMVPKFKRT